MSVEGEAEGIPTEVKGADSAARRESTGRTRGRSRSTSRGPGARWVRERWQLTPREKIGNFPPERFSVVSGNLSVCTVVLKKWKIPKMETRKIIQFRSDCLPIEMGWEFATTVA